MAPSTTLNDPIENTALEPIAICGMACRLPGGINSDSSFWKMLVEKRNGQTPRVPASRFNIDAHLHENLDRPGSFNVSGGYFLDGSPEDFDPGFFNMTPIEAQWLDPQQRKILEVSYECLVSAGLTLEKVAGSNTAVFVGSFTSDYQQMSIRDPDFRHNYAATGVDTGIISNRIGNAFNLNGPSFTINTACSSSVYAIHNACHALRARDCDAAIAGGVNLIITVDQHMNTAKLGILSPTSTCHTFDASADGYGRAEGAGALYLKRLSDAVRDGDPIRGVIRSTAVNTNGKVDGMGITHPSVAGQERVVRMAYEKANLNPRLTAYAELHGTGTPVGDPIEVKAISRALNDERSKDKPLLIGAVKPNIGHSEAASGIFAVMKAALMTEAAVIPGVAFFERLNPEIKENDWNVKVHAETAPWPKDSDVRRVSVSSFGYGGTNGHVIVESIDSLYPWYRHGKAKKVASYDHSSKRPFLLTVSAHDKPTLLRNVKAIGAVAAEYYAADLAYTLNLRRSHFSHRTFTILREGQETEAFEQSALHTGATPKKAGGVGFLFTGQGAQWLGMGRVALKEFPVFLDTIQRLDSVLSRLTPKPSFTIEELLADPSTSQEKINDAEVTQPLCTAIQIALVDLFALWNITPLVSIGHSSGEIGAAYASGLISAPEAIIAAFCRGRAVKEFSTVGSMLAVGLGSSEVGEFLGSDASKICIACENSPSSVTLSGDAESISQLGAELTSKGIFARELKTGRAYHSPHMAPIGTKYDDLLAHALLVLRTQDLEWRRPRTEMVSSVTGERISKNTLPKGYWSANLRQRVLFSTAVHRMATDDQFAQVTSIIEIGPHAALSGPFKQICMANKLDRFTYTPSLMRNKNDADQILSIAGSLHLAGYAVDLEEVNSDYQRDAISIRKPKTQYLLTDLPPYQWNYEKRYWAEPRGSVEQRGRIYDRHDLLGSRVSGLSQNSKVWRNILRQRDVPWLKDHTLGGTAIFPAAGHLSLAIEALRQVHETDGLAFGGVSIRDVDIKTALVIPESDGIEVVVCLQPMDGSDWHAFTVESIADDKWSLHAKGKISALQTSVKLGHHPVAETALSRRVSGKRWYDAFHRVGFSYTNTFQQLLEARTDESVHQAVGDVAVLDKSGIMQGESRYMIHPSTIDACLQLIIISIHAGKHKEMPWGVVPTRIEEVVMTFPKDDAGSTGKAVAWTDGFEGRRYNTHTQLTGKSGKPLMNITGLTCISYEAALPAAAREAARAAETFSVSTWKPDIATFTTSDYLANQSSSHFESITNLLELIRHRQNVKSVAVYGSPSKETITTVLEALASGSTITVSFSGEQEVDLSDDMLAQVTVQTLPVSPSDWAAEAGDHVFDLVLADFTGLPESKPNLDATEVSALVKPGGWLIGALTDFLAPPTAAARSSHHFSLLKPQKETVNGVDHMAGRITVLSVLPPTPSCQQLAEALSHSGREVRLKSIVNFQAASDHHIVIDDTTGTLFNTINKESYVALQAVLTSGYPILWLTQGVNQGRSPAGGMAEGFLRVIRSEQAASRVALLDASVEEKPLDLAEAIVAKLDSANIKDSGDDTEFWLHEGVLHIPRVYPRNDLNEKWNRAANTKDISDEPLPSGSPLTARLGESGVVFEPKALPVTLDDAEVEIQVYASEVLFGARSQVLVAGTILRVGSTLDKTVVGKQAVAIVNGGLQTIARTSLFIPVDDEFGTPESLVGSLVPLQGLAYAFSNQFAIGVDRKSRVISLPGPKPLTALTVLLARDLGWDFTIILKSEEEQKRYISQYSLHVDNVFVLGDTCDLLSLIRTQFSQKSSLSIIAHEFSALEQEVWRNIPGASQFFLLSNEAPLSHAPDALPFTRGASFIPVNSKVLRASSKVAIEILKSSMGLAKAHPKLLSHYGDYTKVIDSTASDVNTEVQNETLVMRFNYGADQAKILPKEPELSLSPHGTYLLVGCLGGLGRSLTKWMMKRGARHFAFLSRSGADKPEAARVIKGIEEKGASAIVFQADAADEDEVKRIVLLLQGERPILGVVHAAMVLKDGMFEQMDYYSFMAATVPKAKGAISLHNALQGIDLDFFVMTSSISAVLGNTGQSNYSSANSFLDSLALYRNVNGLAASSLVLPMVLDVGVVAENDSIEQSLLRKGLYGINEQEMLRGFEVAMSVPRPASSTVVATKSMNSQLIMGLEASELAKSINGIGADNADLYWFNDARFIHVREALEESTGSGGSGGGDENFAAIVKVALAQGIDAVVEAIAMHVVKRMSGILMIPIEQFELNGPSLASYGLDSMIGAEMRTWLFKEFGLDYPFQKLLAPTLTFTNLGTVIAGKMGFIKTTES